MTRRVQRLWLSAAAALMTASCGAPFMRLPSGPGVPASDAAAVIAQATSACRAVNTITLEMSVHGSANGRRLRGRLTAGLATPASARLEAAAPFGQPLFIFVATADDASLLLPRDRRLLEHGTPADVLEAVSGVPLDAPGLRSLITGCASAPDASGAVSFGDSWRVASDGADTVYFHRSSSTLPWRLVTTTRRLTRPEQGRGTSLRAGPGWRAEYSMFENNLPRMIRLVSEPPGRFDLQLDLSQIEVNGALGPEAFRLERTAGAGTISPISIEELRQSGPLGEK